MTIVAACDRDLYATTADGKLARISGKLVWLVPIGNAVLPDGVDPCDGPTLLAVTPGPSLVAIARDTGKVVGRVDGVRGVWTHGDSIEVGTAFGVVRYSHDLATSQPLALPALGPLIASRGDRRLVRATPSTAVVLDAQRVRAFVPLEAPSGALGDETLLDGDRLARLPRAWRRPLRLPAAPLGIALPAELRDLPAMAKLDESRAIALPRQCRRAARDRDRSDQAAIYAAAGEVVARFDLAARVELASRRCVSRRRDGARRIAFDRRVRLAPTLARPPRRRRRMASERRRRRAVRRRRSSSRATAIAVTRLR